MGSLIISYFSLSVSALRIRLGSLIQINTVSGVKGLKWGNVVSCLPNSSSLSS